MEKELKRLLNNYKQIIVSETICAVERVVKQRAEKKKIDYGLLNEDIEHFENKIIELFKKQVSEVKPNEK